VIGSSSEYGALTKCAATRWIATLAPRAFFRNGSGVWAQEQRLTASDAEAWDRFGNSVAIEGDTIVTGAPKSRWTRR
jgi:hypothetical protein